MNTLPPPDFNQLLQWAMDIQQIPAPTFSEGKRAEYLKRCFENLGIPRVEIDEVGNVVCKIAGGDADPILVTAHLDTVHSMEQSLKLSRTEFSVTGAGIGDNSLGVASMLALAKSILAAGVQPEGDIWFVGTVGEEGLGNLKGIKALSSRFASPPHCSFVLEGIGLGQLQQRALGVNRMRISVETPGGHSWSDYGCPSAINVLVTLAAAINTIKLPVQPRTTVNIGTICGGTAVNTIASNASMEIDLRSEDAATLTTITEYVRKKADLVKQEGVKITLEQIGSRPSGSIPLKDPFLTYAQDLYTSLGVPPRLIISSTDASLLIQKGWPVLSIGLTTGEHVHTPEETIELLPLRIGMEFLFQLVAGIWKIHR
jgi:acetylornithine deacetylase/succinyl-diaminopimelate desuccinylase-like protein